jgi:hypothetical protein
MKIIPIDSSILESVGYNPKRLVLTIAFHNRSVYEYYDVPETTYLELLTAASKGRFFHERILGVYAAKRV